jgi:hypothetical protein
MKTDKGYREITLFSNRFYYSNGVFSITNSLFDLVVTVGKRYMNILPFTLRIRKEAYLWRLLYNGALIEIEIELAPFYLWHRLKGQKGEL